MVVWPKQRDEGNHDALSQGDQQHHFSTEQPQAEVLGVNSKTDQRGQ